MWSHGPATLPSPAAVRTAGTSRHLLPSVPGGAQLAGKAPPKEPPSWQALTWHSGYPGDIPASKGMALAHSLFPRAASTAKAQSLGQLGGCTPAAARWGNWALSYPQIGVRHLHANNRACPQLLCEKGKTIAACEGAKYLHPLRLPCFPSLPCEAQGELVGQCRAARRGSPPHLAGLVAPLRCIWGSLISTNPGESHSSISSSEILECTFLIHFPLQTSKKLTQALRGEMFSSRPLAFSYCTHVLKCRCHLLHNPRRAGDRIAMQVQSPSRSQSRARF